MCTRNRELESRAALLQSIVWQRDGNAAFLKAKKSKTICLYRSSELRV